MSKPLAPRIGFASLLDSSSTSVTVRWTRLTATGITGYQIVSVPSTRTVSAASTASSAVFADLARGTSYVFKVGAKNAAGVGAYSASSNSVSIPCVVPFAPTNLVATNEFGTNVVVLSWSVPNSGGGQISSYTIESEPSDVQAVTVVTNSATLEVPYSIAYQFRVCATNEVGTGDWSAYSSSVKCKELLDPAVVRSIQSELAALSSITVGPTGPPGVIVPTDTLVVEAVTFKTVTISTPISVESFVLPTSSSEIGFTSRSPLNVPSQLTPVYQSIGSISLPPGVWFLCAHITLTNVGETSVGITHSNVVLSSGGEPILSVHNNTTVVLTNGAKHTVVASGVWSSDVDSVVDVSISAVTSGGGVLTCTSDTSESFVSGTRIA